MKPIEIKGIDEILKKLDGLANDELINTGIAKTASFVQGQAKLLAAVDTGDLRDSIKVSGVRDFTAEVFTNSDHAVFVEYGTGTKGDPAVDHTTKNSWTYLGTDGKFHTTHGMEPRPFMRPAAKSGEEQMADIFNAIIKKELNK